MTRKIPTDQTTISSSESPRPNTHNSSRDTSRTFSETMHQARSHMSQPNRLLSRIIHFRPIEVLATGIAETIARPSAILYGGTGVLIVTALSYSVAKYYGYPLAGSEALLGFFAGWLIGLLVDYTSLLIRGGRRRNRR